MSATCNGCDMGCCDREEDNQPQIRQYPPTDDVWLTARRDFLQNDLGLSQLEADLLLYGGLPAHLVEKTAIV